MFRRVMESYRSGHNGADSKSVRCNSHVGSNPTLSAKEKARQSLVFSLEMKDSDPREVHAKRGLINFLFQNTKKWVDIFVCHAKILNNYRGEESFDEKKHKHQNDDGYGHEHGYAYAP